MKTFKTQINITPQKNEYIIGSDLLEHIPDFDKFLILSDESVFSLHGKKLTDFLQKRSQEMTVSLIKPGEISKDLSTLNKTIAPFFKTVITKNTALIAIGGGVVTDIGGFIASILLRGIPTIFIPTTLLSQVDAGIGGKNGMNITLGNITLKNMVGTITQPTLVLSDTDFLHSLPDKEFLSGLGEIAKYTIGWGIPQLSLLLKAKDNVEEIVFLCQKLKIEIIQKDPDDTKHIRESLNFGHTIGHAVEGVGNGKYSHGQAVSIGLCASIHISRLLGYISQSDLDENVSLIRSLGLPTKAQGLSQLQIKKAMQFDKKSGTFVLLTGKHTLKTNVRVPQEIISKAIEEIV